LPEMLPLLRLFSSDLEKFEYLPYGETWLEKGESNDNPKYNSQELDEETGYYYYNARHYDAALARFVTADTVIDGEYSVSGWNRYAYVSNNPVLYKDPTGHNAWSGTGFDPAKPWSNDAVDSVGEYNVNSCMGKPTAVRNVENRIEDAPIRVFNKTVASIPKFGFQESTTANYFAGFADRGIDNVALGTSVLASALAGNMAAPGVGAFAGVLSQTAPKSLETLKGVASFASDPGGTLSAIKDSWAANGGYLAGGMTFDVASGILAGGFQARGTKFSIQASKSGRVQVHHKAPWSNKTFNHQNHPLVKQAEVNLKTYRNNLMDLGNHAGRHSPEYHRGVQNIFNKHYRSAIGKGKSGAQNALDNSLTEIENSIKNGVLNPYSNKDVWIP
ncbi:MAG: RHS repeat-associated core domain-containing protein, partial [Bacteroidales bacterium]|nr:RHS repeat-associated core domain-containing protein [Bacteroidales bacterium]